MKKTMFLAAMFALMFGVDNHASAQRMDKAKGKVTGAEGAKCTPKVGDDAELAIHYINGDDPVTGQKKGTYFLITVVQGGKREGTSIKGGSRTGLRLEVDQKYLEEVKKLTGKSKLAMAKITKVEGTFSFGSTDDVAFETSDGSKTGKATISRKGKTLGSFMYEVK